MMLHDISHEHRKGWVRAEKGEQPPPPGSSSWLGLDLSTVLGPSRGQAGQVWVGGFREA